MPGTSMVWCLPLSPRLKCEEPSQLPSSVSPTKWKEVPSPAHSLPMALESCPPLHPCQRPRSGHVIPDGPLPESHLAQPAGPPLSCDWLIGASGLTLSVPSLKLSAAPYQLLEKVRIPQRFPSWSPLGDQPSPPPWGPVHQACPHLRDTGFPFLLLGWRQRSACCCSFSRSSFLS